jgi:hypothetical protein
VLQIDSGIALSEIDCEDRASGFEGADADAAFESCRRGDPGLNGSNSHLTTVAAWKKTGLVMLGAHAGATLTVYEDVALILDVSAMQMLPATGFALEPSLGVRTGF